MSKLNIDISEKKDTKLCRCPFLQKCKWKGELHEVIRHLVDTHKIRMVDDANNTMLQTSIDLFSDKRVKGIILKNAIYKMHLLTHIRTRYKDDKHFLTIKVCDISRIIKRGIYQYSLTIIGPTGAEYTNIYSLLPLTSPYISLPLTNSSVDTSNDFLKICIEDHPELFRITDMDKKEINFTIKVFMMITPPITDYSDHSDFPDVVVEESVNIDSAFNDSEPSI